MSNNRTIGMPGTMAGIALALGGAAFAGFLNQRRKGSAGDAPFYTLKRPDTRHAVVGRTVTIRKSRDELYEYWRDFANLPRFMENVETIRKDGDAHVWVIKAPAGRSVDVKTTISEDRKGEVIAWRSVEGSDIETTGQVSFEDAPGDRGTRVSLVMSYDPPAGELGRAIAKLFQREPQVQARHDLERFKMLMETGEIATSAHTKDATRKAKQQETER